MLSYISNLDSSILYAVQAIGPAWRPVAMFLSHALDYKVMVAIFLIALFLMRKHRVAIELFFVSAVSFVATFLLKVTLRAPRPFSVDSLVMLYDKETGYGLPSAHALMSVVIFGWIATRHPKSHMLTWGSVAVIVLIGLSRVYLGVHYPSQVLAGWIFGILFLYIFRALDRRLWPRFEKRIRR